MGQENYFCTSSNNFPFQVLCSKHLEILWSHEDHETEAIKSSG
jgi:hypothetical protein